MKTEDIKKMAQAWQQVQEASKKNEELKGNQHKIDHDKDGKITAADFKGLRKKSKKDQEVETVTSEAKIDEISQDKLRQYHAKAGADLQAKRAKVAKGELSMADLKKGQNRVKGLNRAAAKMEDVEQVDEISKKTLGSYIKKASTDQAGQAYKLGAGDEKDFTRAFKRKAGIAKATDKLTKEETGWTVYERIKESRAAHYKGATKPETMDDKLKGKGAKDMANQPVNTSDIPSTHQTDIQKASATKKAPARTGDQTKGDKSIVNPVKDTTK